MYLFFSFGEKCEFVVHTEHIVDYTVFSKLVNMLVKHTKDYITFVFLLIFFLFTFFANLLYSMQKLAS